MSRLAHINLFKSCKNKFSSDFTNSRCCFRKRERMPNSSGNQEILQLPAAAAAAAAALDLTMKIMFKFLFVEKCCSKRFIRVEPKKISLINKYIGL